MAASSIAVAIITSEVANSDARFSADFGNDGTARDAAANGYDSPTSPYSRRKLERCNDFLPVVVVVVLSSSVSTKTVVQPKWDQFRHNGLDGTLRRRQDRYRYLIHHAILMNSPRLFTCSKIDEAMT